MFKKIDSGNPALRQSQTASEARQLTEDRIAFPCEVYRTGRAVTWQISQYYHLEMPATDDTLVRHAQIVFDYEDRPRVPGAGRR
jgi:hypothetical protein